MISTQARNTYAEVYIIFKKLNLLSLLPENISKKLLQEKNNEHSFNFDINMPFSEQIQNISTKAMISYLYIKYISDDISEKKYLLNKFKEKELERIKTLNLQNANELNMEDLFESSQTLSFSNNNNENSIDNIDNSKHLLKQKETIFQKFINKIKAFLKR